MFFCEPKDLKEYPLRLMLCLFLDISMGVGVTAQTMQHPMVITGYVRDFDG